MASQARLEMLRAQIAILEAPRGKNQGRLSFGDPGLDQALGGGLALGCWHEVLGEKMEAETGALATAFVAALSIPLSTWGPVVWILRRRDLYAPGLASLGFPSERLIQVHVRQEHEALGVLEEVLSSPGVAAAIAEAGPLDLVSGRRLHLACATSGATGFLIRRQPFGQAGGRPLSEGSPRASTRWRLTPAPSAPRAERRGQIVSGLGPLRWRAALERVQGGRPGAWLLEHSDGPFPIRVVAKLADCGEPAGATPLADGGHDVPIWRVGG